MTSTKESAPAQSPEALQRLIKRRILGMPQSAVLRFPKGFGPVCEHEVRTLLSRDLLQPKMTPILTLTDKSLNIESIGWRDLVCLAATARTVREVLWPIGGGRAGSVGEVKDRLAAVDWPLYLKAGMALAIRANSTASHVFHEGKLAELAGAAVKRAGAKVVDRDGAEHLLDLRLDEDRLTIYLSLSGRPLYMRRYKQELKGVATIKEDIAAAALAATTTFAAKHGMSDFTRILVPFAGSGTLGFEAALAFMQIPPAIFFGPLSAETFPCSPTASLRFAETKSLLRTRELAAARPSPTITFNDSDVETCRYLEQNITAFNARLRAYDLPLAAMDVVPGDLFKLRLSLLAKAESPPPKSVPSTLILLNPPFGGRLGAKPSAGSLYAKVAKEINDLKEAHAGFVLAPTLAVADRFLAGLKCAGHEVHPFNHGGRTVYLVIFAKNYCEQQNSK